MVKVNLLAFSGLLLWPIVFEFLRIINTVRADSLFNNKDFSVTSKNSEITKKPRIHPPNEFLQLNSEEVEKIFARKRKLIPRAPFLDTLQSSSQEVGVGDKDKRSTIIDQTPNPSSKKSKSDDVQGKSSRKREQVIPLQHHYFQEMGLGGTGTTVRCFCDTAECLANGQTTCTSSGMCYTQVLELNDGSPPLTKGCIIGETPLLCENRPPKMPGPYPHLSCCKTHLCNAMSPLLTPRLMNIITTTSTTSEEITEKRRMPYINQEDVNNEGPRPVIPRGYLPDPVGEDSDTGGGRHDRKSPNRSNDMFSTDASSEKHTDHIFENSATRELSHDDDDESRTRTIFREKHSKTKESEETNGISLLASSFLISGAISVVLISAVGYYILRKENRTDNEVERKSLNLLPEDPIGPKMGDSGTAEQIRRNLLTSDPISQC